VAAQAIAVAAGTSSYVVDVGTHSACDRLAALARGKTAALLVSDENVAPLHAASLDAGFAAAGLLPGRLTLPPGELSKAPASIERLWRAACGTRSQSIVVALGGGVVNDRPVLRQPGCAA
jgi:3-dehydroquinate synthetase